jgi:3-keto-disaccharide hydrolase
MKRLIVLTAAVLAASCATVDGWMGWTTLIDGEKGMDNFNKLGAANWRAEGGAIIADKSPDNSYLVTKNSYKDFVIRAEFWADKNTNSGIFIRAQNARKIGADNAYEVNIYDARPGQEYSTGGIVNFAKVPVPAPYKAVGRWNTFEITAKGSTITVVFNGQKTVEMTGAKWLEGPFALQFGNHGKAPGHVIKWRKVQVKAL